MSLDKSARRKEKVREINRRLRSQGLVFLGEPGPWFSITLPFQFQPSFFPGLLASDPPQDKNFIGDVADLKS
jgi:hypothetical protein